MQISVLLAEQIAELFLMILMGYVIVKLGLVTDDDSKILSKIVLYIVIPCVMINAFQIDYTTDKVQGMFLALVASVVLQVLLLIADKSVRTSSVLCGITAIFGISAPSSCIFRMNVE